MGRALQREAAAPDYFLHPRIVVAIVADPPRTIAQPIIPLKDRLYLGYQEVTNSIEVISYDASIGQFSFQIVENYRAGQKPTVTPANHQLCTACHQHGRPIWSEPLWDETPANAAVARRLRATLQQSSRDSFHGVSVATSTASVTASFAFARSVERANRLPLMQTLWRTVCQGPDDALSARCRAGLLLFALQHRLSGNRHFERRSPWFRDTVLPMVLDNWRAHWPDGIPVHQPMIANRNPLAGNGTLSVQQNPLTVRQSAQRWQASGAEDVARLIAGLGSFLTLSDVQMLADELARPERRHLAPRHRLSADCAFSGKDLAGWAYQVRFVCGGAKTDDFEMYGSLQAKNDGAIKGSIVRVVIGEHESFENLEISSNALLTPEAPAAIKLRMQQSIAHLEPRRADGSALVELEFQWQALAAESTDPSGEPARPANNGRGLISVIEDFHPVRAAIAEMVTATAEDNSLFDNSPFDHTRLLKSLFIRLGMSTPCCEDRDITCWNSLIDSCPLSRP